MLEGSRPTREPRTAARIRTARRITPKCPRVPTPESTLRRGCNWSRRTQHSHAPLSHVQPGRFSIESFNCFSFDCQSIKRWRCSSSTLAGTFWAKFGLASFSCTF